MPRPTALFRSSSALVLAAMACIAGCASQPVSPPRKDLLAFLDDTPRCDELGDRLGSPSGTYEGGRLITYRIAEDTQERYSVVQQADWIKATHTLAVTCGSDGTVTRHSLVAVKIGGQ
jgi:hypothetical protein